MALLTLDERKAIFKELGLEYNEATIKALQSKYMLRKKDADGIYGTNTDNMLRTVWNTLRLTKNFKPEEFRCDCGGRHCCGFPSYMKANELKHIQAIRDHWGRPITVTQGLRCKGRNKELKGSAVNSGHMYGRAIDFYQKGVTDTLANRKMSIKWIKKQFAHKYSYGNGIDSSGYKYNAPYMGNCLHTETTGDNMAEIPKHKEEEVKPTKPVYKVIDVSDWQDKIDWNKVKADGVVGAIIRYADGTTLDKRFQENMVNAKAAGLHIGSYIFSRAKTKAQAEAEAERLFNACKPYDLDMPLYIDLEVASLSKYADTVAPAFLNKMKALGGRGGVYANLNWWNHYLTGTAKNYSASPFWIAQYNDTMDYKPADRMGMWQYTSSGKVDGINGKVDMDKCYVAYWNTHQKNSKAEEIVAHAKEYAYPEGTKASEYDYAKGKALPAYADALKKYMGKTAKISQTDCGYFVSTCVRASGVSSDFLALPANASKPYPSVPSTMSIVHTGSLSGFNLKAGDIIRYRKEGGQHTVLYIGGGRIAHASRKHAFPRISTAKPWNNSNVKTSTIQVLRAK